MCRTLSSTYLPSERPAAVIRAMRESCCDVTHDDHEVLRHQPSRVGAGMMCNVMRSVRCEHMQKQSDELCKHCPCPFGR